MPWCDTCDRFWNPNTLRDDGTCPTCGRLVAEPGGEAAEAPRAPWHFKLLVAAVVLYLGWRGWQGVEWVLQRL
jgi:hypothetical protein